ncbi:hypothetical protein [Turneriella parva]|uniref:Uncharacterized protein n=1 Tax=Turneriella parva (strain ATCC BAA-1111 / DSM 21527 / NCTC 11395 / H) TaxID=869212 RepID=I4BAK7_TURPD|nr:hypothetical protein [Turneriella parva]AFM14314.1 hypothetical protein Turpa_3680 [Turneriella parva DSM 21527]
MRKALSSLVALAVSALIISTIISFFMRDSFETLPVKASSAPVKPTRRMQDTAFLVSAEHISRYDFNWLTEKLSVLAGESPQRILPVPVNFYLANALNHAEYPAAALDLIDAECNVRSDKVASVKRYFKALQVNSSEGKKTGLHIASFRAIPESVTLRYSDNTARAAKCLGAQLTLIGEITLGQDPSSLVVPALQSVRVNLAPYERAQLLNNAARNIYSAIAEAYKKNPAYRARVLLTNAVPYAQAQVLPFSELAGQFVGLTPDELTAVRAGVIALNGSIAFVPDLAKQVEIGIDTSVIWQLWQTAKIPFFKDASGEPLVYEDLILTLRRSLTDADAAGVIQNRKLKVIYAAYARDNDEKRKLGESINLAYQRSSNERLQKLQLQLFLDVYDFSAVGLEAETYIALEMPARQKFPLIHMVARPLAKRWGFEEKKDGSDTSEIEDSLLLLRNTLAQAGK